MPPPILAAAPAKGWIPPPPAPRPRFAVAGDPEMVRRRSVSKQDSQAASFTTPLGFGGGSDGSPEAGSQQKKAVLASPRARPCNRRPRGQFHPEPWPRSRRAGGLAGPNEMRFDRSRPRVLQASTPLPQPWLPPRLHAPGSSGPRKIAASQALQNHGARLESRLVRLPEPPRPAGSLPGLPGHRRNGYLSR